MGALGWVPEILNVLSRLRLLGLVFRLEAAKRSATINR